MKDSECKLMRVSAVAREAAYRFAASLNEPMAKGSVLTYLVRTHPKMKKFWAGCVCAGTVIPQAAGKGGDK